MHGIEVFKDHLYAGLGGVVYWQNVVHISAMVYDSVLGVLSACVLCVGGKSRQLFPKMGRSLRGRHIGILCLCCAELFWFDIINRDFY